MARCVVAGFDGSERSLLAAGWAAREAALRGLGLRLVHASTEALSPVVDRALSALVLHHPGLKIEGRRADGRAADVLADAGRSATLLVLGARGLGGFPGLRLGSVALETAGRAPCPVVLVPEHGPVGDHPPEVVLGIDGRHPADEATGFAFDATRRREARLRAVHAWSLPAPHDSPWVPYGVTGEDRATWEDREVQLLRDALRRRRTKCPAVAVTPDVRLLGAAQALVTASARADLLVIGRARRCLDGVPHAVAHHACCPVALVPYS
ncbi:universal stress protein [Actinacidiphila oryziradicis]|uniref:Universal stress protein n=1 Tax=Actinacidiphila oryziradicis TaxID=2571141 RepID=A0A4U0R6B2_9ACTN|nr:universal stress protein [Actinacidiphila oryziradicis]TJZ90533.1 universal stress protein [Actinacidiphila oryziradicis]